MSEPHNLVILVSDEHDPRYMGVSGHPFISTPNLDSLAARGRRYTAATTTSPICVPARASMATGLYPHQNRYWDNALAYDGAVESWGHRLQRANVPVESIGKLHYRSAEAPTGFDHQHIPMHIAAGKGMIWGSVRDPLPVIPYRDRPRMIGDYVGPGETDYSRFDNAVTERTIEWLRERAAKPRGERPWVLFVGLVSPHFPLVAPPEYASLYTSQQMPQPKLRPEDGHARHPWVQAMHDYWPHDEGFESEAERREAIRMYCALCSFLDHNVGRIVDALDGTGLAAETRLIYMSDHGDNLGSRGMWGKSTLYQESVAIPMIVNGPDIEAGTVEDRPVSLVDLYPTVLDAVGLVPDDGGERPGMSLLGEIPGDRTTFSEYHAIGSVSGGFMVRRGRWKYNYYVGYEPELFDLESDPEEFTNLAGRPEHADTLARMHAALLAICDPEKVDALAKADQAALVEQHGGREKALGIGPLGATPAATA